ncbi:MAG TPA: DUF2461 domain-containing protein [Anaeromyxobacteraceae bacterium]|nr:DUF2461 domain-containing protein [Anaeromyxobacteraceae bacterium]
MARARAGTATRSPWFTPALFTFLEELRLHNDRDWFERNRDRYLRDVRDPMLRFVADAAPVLKRLAPRIVADPRPVGGSMFRIHRDQRFSKDKTPYKTNVAASFHHAAGRASPGPAFYVSLEPGAIQVGGGVWHPEAEPLGLIRRAILDDPAGWRRALRAPGLDRLTWWGDSLARTPKGFAPGHPLDAWLRRRDFAAGLELGEADALAPDLLDRCAAAWRSLCPAMGLLAKAVGLPW